MVASCLAAQAGARRPSSITLKPSAMRSVTAAAALRTAGASSPGAGQAR